MKQRIRWGLVAMTISFIIVACSKNQPSKPEQISYPAGYPAPWETTLNGVSLGPASGDTSKEDPQHQGALRVASTTYASGVIPWHDNIEGDEDWMAVFYLPYQPSVVNFYGLTRLGFWTNFNGWVQLYDARWTSNGFRVMIFMGDKVTIQCGTSPSRYRLVY